jgi:thymidylate synthase (FAD)
MNVQLVSKTQVDPAFLERTLEEAGIDREELPENLTEALIVYIARVSSSRENKWEDHEKLIRYLIEHRHWSPFEHAHLTFEITTSRAIGRQLLRHRSFTFQEFSQRYAEATEFEEVELRAQAEKNRQSSTDVVNPDLYLGDHDAFGTHGVDIPASDLVAEHLERTRILYQELLDAGVARETARMILPECTQTTLYMTGNLRSWIHFLELRADEHAQKEVRKIAYEVQKVITNLFLNVSVAADITSFKCAKLPTV